jgi:hypothetical protein
MAFYSKEKARYGGVTGTIVPYPRQMPTANAPDQGNWRIYLPAGFLRCNGEVLTSDQYPVLAQVLGTGSDSKFKKADVTLQSNEFQLPDLGSKYVLGANSSGAYLNDTVIRDDDGRYRVGCEVNVTSLIGETETITYDGYFEVVASGLEQFIGNPSYSTTGSGGATLAAQLSEQNFQSHGHDSNVGVFTYLGKWNDSFFFDNDGASGGDNEGQNEGSNNLVLVQSPPGSSATVSHTHRINFPSTSAARENNGLRYEYLNTQIEAFGLETEITVTTNNLYKLDEATPPYILMEYLIKI